MNKAFYDNEREIDLTEQRDLHRREKKIIPARIGIFFAVILTIFFGWKLNYHNAYLGAVILAMIFVRLVNYHNEVKVRQKFLTST